MQLASKSTAIGNPSFLCAGASGNVVYAVNEQDHGGHVYAFSFDAETGVLTYLNQQPVGGDAACYVTTGRAGQYVVVANYGSGTLTALPLAVDGSLLPLSQQIVKRGSSIVLPKPYITAVLRRPDLPGAVQVLIRS